MKRTEELSVNDLTGVYKDLAELLGDVSAVVRIHSMYAGQQVSFPKKLVSREYLVAQVKKNDSSSNVRSIASEFGYTERRLRQIVKESKC